MQPELQEWQLGWGRGAKREKRAKRAKREKRGKIPTALGADVFCRMVQET